MASSFIFYKIVSWSYLFTWLYRQVFRALNFL